MKKVSIQGKLRLQKEKISILNSTEKTLIKGASGIICQPITRFGVNQCGIQTMPDRD
jgi:hypothetical protein